MLDYINTCFTYYIYAHMCMCIRTKIYSMYIHIYLCGYVHTNIKFWGCTALYLNQKIYYSNKSGTSEEGYM